MSAKVKDVLELVNGIAPFDQAEEWDNVGLLAGDPEAEAERVLCALDLSDGVLDEAAQLGAKLIITHHPILFRGRKNLRETDAEGRLLCRLVRERVALIAAHTNYDLACPGVNDALAAELDLQNIETIEKIMRVGAVTPGKLGSFAGFVEARLRGPVRVFGDADAPVRRVAVVGGSGGDYIETALAAGADVLVTGEVSYHRGTDAAANGLCVLEAGHAATERPGISVLAGALQIASDALQYRIRFLVSQATLFL